MTMPELETTDFPSVELFSVGTWRGDEYTEADLDEMVRAAEEIPHLKRPVKLGHTDEVGKPAVGWVENLRREGSKLYGDLKKVPKSLADLISSGAYRKRSAEVYWDYTDGQSGQTYPRVFRALALLGADIPAVNNLDDIVALYDDEDGHEVRTYNLDEGGASATVTSVGEGPATQTDDTPHQHVEEETSEEDAMKEQLYDILGLDPGVPEDEALALVQGLATTEVVEFSEDATAAVIKAYQGSDEYKTLKADAEAGRAASQKLYEMQRDTVIKTAVTEGRIVPADVEKWSKRYDESPNLTTEVISELPVVIEFGERGDGSMKEQRGDVVAEIRAYMAEQGIGYEDAAMAVLQQRGEV